MVTSGNALLISEVEACENPQVVVTFKNYHTFEKLQYTFETTILKKTTKFKKSKKINYGIIPLDPSS